MDMTEVEERLAAETTPTPEEPEDRGDTFTPTDEPVATEVTTEATAEPTQQEEEREPVVIPKARFDEVNGKAKALETEAARIKAENEALRQQLESLQEKKAKETAQSVEDAQVAYELALLEGEDAETLAGLRRAYNDAMKAAILADVQTTIKQETKAVTAEEKEQLEVDKTLNKVYTDYPFLNPEAPEADQRAVKLVENSYYSYLAAGLPRAEAVMKAVEDVAPVFAPVVDPDKTKNDAATARATEARTRNAQASIAQPPITPNAEKSGHVNYDVSKMTDAEFDRLPEETKKRIRGD